MPTYMIHSKKFFFPVLNISECVSENEKNILIMYDGLGGHISKFYIN